MTGSQKAFAGRVDRGKHYCPPTQGQGSPDATEPFRGSRPRSQSIRKHMGLLYFPMAAVTDHDMLSGLKHHELTFYNSGGQKGDRGPTWLKSRGFVVTLGPPR